MSVQACPHIEGLCCSALRAVNKLDPSTRLKCPLHVQVYSVLSSHPLPDVLPAEAQSLLPGTVQLRGQLLDYGRQQNCCDCGLFAFLAQHKMCCAIMRAGDMSTADVQTVYSVLSSAGLHMFGESETMRDAVAHILLQRQIDV